MSKKHEITENGEKYLSHVAIKKKYGVSRKKLNDWVKAGKIRTISREVARMPHQLMNDPQLELHYYSVADLKNVQAEEKKE
jgi:hypothetical protein